MNRGHKQQWWRMLREMMRHQFMDVALFFSDRCSLFLALGWKKSLVMLLMRGWKFCMSYQIHIFSLTVALVLFYPLTYHHSYTANCLSKIKAGAVVENTCSYSSSLLKHNSEVLVLYLSISTFCYFDSTTFQQEILYFLHFLFLHYTYFITLNACLQIQIAHTKYN